MDLRHLRYFAVVAEEMSFTRASQRLHIAQPPLSQQIRDLEEELGFSLFIRGGRSIMLTQAGKEFLPEALQILDRFNKLQQNALLRARGDLGHLTIGLISSMARPTVAARLRAFRKLNPGIKISVVQQPSSWLVPALISGEIDVGFLRTTVDLDNSLDFEIIRREPMKLAVPSDHVFSGRKIVEWKELAGHPMVLIERNVTGPRYYDAFFKNCRKYGFEPLVQQYTANIAVQVWVVSAGLGIAPITIVPDMHHLSGVELIDLPDNAPVFETAMAWRKSDYSAALLKFIAFWRPIIGRIVP